MGSPRGDNSEMSTAVLLTAHETCSRKGYYSARWEAKRMSGTEMLYAGLDVGLSEAERPDFGEAAGEHIMGLAEERGLETSAADLYGSVLHHAALCDVVTSAVRKPGEAPWRRPETTADGWVPGCFLSPDGTHLRRVVLVSTWSDDRHYAEIRSWRTWGEIAAYGLPMQQVVCVLGPHWAGRRHSAWTKGLLHPANHQLRFRKRNAVATGFKETWESIWREDHGEIDRAVWLQSMLTDDVLPELLFTVTVPVPRPETLARIRSLAAQKQVDLLAAQTAPAGNLSTCDWPAPCPFRGCCLAVPELAPRAPTFLPVLQR